MLLSENSKLLTETTALSTPGLIVSYRIEEALRKFADECNAQGDENNGELRAEADRLITSINNAIENTTEEQFQQYVEEFLAKLGINLTDE